jgi:preprotein translocase subunit YajC
VLTLLAAAPTTQTTDAPWWMNSPIIPMVAAGAILLLIMNKNPKRGKDKEMSEMLKSLKRGDRVQTIGGILGTVSDIRDDEVVVKVDENANAKIRFTRSAILRVVVDDDKATEAKK